MVCNKYFIKLIPSFILSFQKNEFNSSLWILTLIMLPSLINHKSQPTAFPNNSQHQVSHTSDTTPTQPRPPPPQPTATTHQTAETILCSTQRERFPAQPIPSLLLHLFLTTLQIIRLPTKPIKWWHGPKTKFSNQRVHSQHPNTHGQNVVTLMLSFETVHGHLYRL